MSELIRKAVQKQLIEASAPCRVDMGGTLDLSTFYLPLRSHAPATFNIALDLRTSVRLEAGERGLTRVKSKGFRERRYPVGQAPFDHPLGLMFAIANYFEADGVRILIDSKSPPRSALGGSSAAAVALVAAFSKALEAAGGKPRPAKKIALLAHALEGSVAGVPCGLQDHLAAAFGGANAWFWPAQQDAAAYRKLRVLPMGSFKELERHLLVAYCGVPHESKNINSRWVRQFLAGRHRRKWIQICDASRKFAEALGSGNYSEAADCMNREVVLRRKMTPDVLDAVGKKLVAAALKTGCGARFTGAGGGGCVWAVGESENIDTLKGMWAKTLKRNKDARLLDAGIDGKGVSVQSVTSHP